MLKILCIFKINKNNLKNVSKNNTKISRQNLPILVEFEQNGSEKHMNMVENSRRYTQGQK